MPFLRVYHTPPDCLICQMSKCTLEHFASAASASVGRVETYPLVRPGPVRWTRQIRTKQALWTHHVTAWRYRRRLRVIDLSFTYSVHLCEAAQALECAALHLIAIVLWLHPSHLHRANAAAQHLFKNCLTCIPIFSSDLLISSSDCKICRSDDALVHPFWCSCRACICLFCVFTSIS